MAIRLSQIPKEAHPLSKERLGSLYSMMELIPRRHQAYYPNIEDVAEAAGEIHDPEAYRAKQAMREHKPQISVMKAVKKVAGTLPSKKLGSRPNLSKVIVKALETKTPPSTGTQRSIIDWMVPKTTLRSPPPMMSQQSMNSMLSSLPSVKSLAEEGLIHYNSKRLDSSPILTKPKRVKVATKKALEINDKNGAPETGDLVVHKQGEWSQ